MRDDVREDPWLLPSHQREYPTRDLLDAATVHGRREATFLVLVTISLLAIAFATIAGHHLILDVAATIAGVIEREVEQRLYAPLAVFVVAISLATHTLVCELFGTRRSRWLLTMIVLGGGAITGAVVTLGAFGDDSVNVRATAVLALAIITAHIVHAVTFDALRSRWRGRRLWIRSWLVAAVAQAVGWTSYGWLQSTFDPAAVALGAAAVAAALGFVVAIAVVALAFMFARYLRIGLVDYGDTAASDHAMPAATRRKPAAVLVDSSPSLPKYGVSARRAARRHVTEMTAVERQFFVEGQAVSKSPTE